MQSQVTGEEWGLSTCQSESGFSPCHLAAPVPPGLGDRAGADSEMVHESQSKVSSVYISRRAAKQVVSTTLEARAQQNWTLTKGCVDHFIYLITRKGNQSTSDYTIQETSEYMPISSVVSYIFHPAKIIQSY